MREYCRIVILTFNHRFRVGLVCKERTRANDSGPDFTDNNRPRGDLDGSSHKISSSIEVKDLAAPILVDEVLDGGGIISDSVTLGSISFDAGKLGSKIVRVRGSASGVNFSC